MTASGSAKNAGMRTETLNPANNIYTIHPIREQERDLIHSTITNQTGKNGSQLYLPCKRSGYTNELRASV